ncbi:hypothetical protein ACFX5K_01350 [Rickettsiales bacterium LUAb2]
MGVWGWLTGKKQQNKANDALQNSVNLTKDVTGQINSDYSNLLNMFNGNGGIGNNLNNLNNLSNNLLGAMNEYQGGANSAYVQNQQNQVNKSFDQAQSNQEAKLTNGGWNPNDRAYNDANASLASARANSLSNVSQQAQQQAYNNYLQGANMYGGLQQNLMNTGLGVNNMWSNALNNSLGQNIAANNALAGMYSNQAGNNLSTLGGLFSMGGSLAKGISSFK